MLRYYRVIPKAPGYFEMYRYTWVLLCCFFQLFQMGAHASRMEKVAAQAEGETLSYRVSYQGLLSAFLPVEIARATLHLHPGTEAVNDEHLRRASLAVSTEAFASIDALYSLRFNYDSWFDPGFAYTTLVNMRKQTSSSREELLWFNRSQKIVRRFTKEGRHSDPGAPALPGFLRQIDHLDSTDGFREKGAFKLTKTYVLDRLAMLYALRFRPLESGETIELAVSNGKDLLGYSIAVEAREKQVLNGRPIAALRLRFTPRFAAGGDRGYAVSVWLSDDERRLPIRFHSASLGGIIELYLEQVSGAPG